MGGGSCEIFVVGIDCLYIFTVVLIQVKIIFPERFKFFLSTVKANRVSGLGQFQVSVFGYYGEMVWGGFLHAETLAGVGDLVEVEVGEGFCKHKIPFSF